MIVEYHLPGRDISRRIPFVRGVLVADSDVNIHLSKTEPKARTMALDPKTHQVFLVTAKFGSAPTPTADQPHPRPPVLPDSFVVLVMGK